MCPRVTTYILDPVQNRVNGLQVSLDYTKKCYQMLRYTGQCQKMLGGLESLRDCQGSSWFDIRQKFDLRKLFRGTKNLSQIEFLLHFEVVEHKPIPGDSRISEFQDENQKIILKMQKIITLGQEIPEMLQFWNSAFRFKFRAEN